MQSQRGIFVPDKKALKFWEETTLLAVKTLKIIKKFPDVKFIFKSKNINRDDINKQIKIINDTNLKIVK